MSVPEKRTVRPNATHASVLGEGTGRVTGGYHVRHQLLFRCTCGGERECVCMYVRVCECVCVWKRVCVCVWKRVCVRERERERKEK